MAALTRVDRVSDRIAAAAVAEARRWLGTPYRHQASARGAGADCLGLVRGVWRALYGREAETPPPYSADWTEVSREERLWDAANRLLAPTGRVAVGNVVLFRMNRASPAKHVAIRSGLSPDRIIHAYSGRSVVDSALTEGWRRRIVAEFRFPEREV